MGSHKRGLQQLQGGTGATLTGSLRCSGHGQHWGEMLGVKQPRWVGIRQIFHVPTHEETQRGHRISLRVRLPFPVMPGRRSTSWGKYQWEGEGEEPRCGLCPVEPKTHWEDALFPVKPVGNQSRGSPWLQQIPPQVLSTPSWGSGARCWGGPILLPPPQGPLPALAARGMRTNRCPAARGDAAAGAIMTCHPAPPRRRGSSNSLPGPPRLAP